jgi:hypothetical protein
MLNLTWKLLSTFKLGAESVVKPWFVALEDFGAATAYLKLKADGKWTPMTGLSACGPDGLTGQSFDDNRLLVSDCAVGALIGRIGGSSASLKAAAPAVDSGEVKPFAVGTNAVLKLPTNVIGPLYLGFNILLRPVAVDSLTVDIFGSSSG